MMLTVYVDRPWQGLQVPSPEDSFTRLGIVANGIVIVNIVFRIRIAGCRCAPVPIQGFRYLFILHELLRMRLKDTRARGLLLRRKFLQRVYEGVKIRR